MEPARTSKSRAKTLRPFVETLQIGDPISHANLTLVPLRGEGCGRLDYILSTEAVESQKLTVSEVDDSGRVPELLAVNTSEQLILLLDGEELVGAKQNRILNTSILLKPKSKTKIPVSCVEQGRWHHISRAFSSGSYSPPPMRAHKSRDVSRNLVACGAAVSNQTRIWKQVDDCLSKADVDSPTGSMHDIVQKYRRSFETYIKALKYPAKARGVVVAITGKFAAMDLFDKPSTLESIWPRLVEGYAMDAIVRRKKTKKINAFTAKGVSALLENVGDIDCTVCPSVGLGKDWRFESQGILGQALVAKRTCLHLSTFPNSHDTDELSHGSRILPPSHRRRGNRLPDDVV